MFTTEYVKNLYDNYMILAVEGEESREADFAYKMLAGNNIKGLLKCSRRMTDMKVCYCYDISCGQAVANTFEKGQLDEYQIQRLIESILKAVDEARKYMLRDDGFVLRPEQTFINITSFELSLCYLPGAGTDLKEELSAFLEFILERVDHNNDKAIVLSYGLYQIVKSDEVSFEKLTGFMDTTMKDYSYKMKPDGIKAVNKPSGRPRVVTERSYGEDEYERYDEYSDRGEYGKDSYNAGYDEDDDKGGYDDRGGYGEDLVDSRDKGQRSKSILAKAAVRFPWLKAAVLCLLCQIAAAGIVYVSGVCTDNGKINTPLWLTASFALGSGLAAGVIYYVKIRSGIKEDPARDGKIKGEEAPGEEATGEETFGEETFGKGTFGEGTFGEKAFGEKAFGEKTVLLSDLNKTGFALKRMNGDARFVRINGFPFVIGKMAGKVDLCIREAAVSRFHAKIEEYCYGMLKITDMNSTNGTYVDGERLTPDVPFPVSPGQRIRFGDVEYLLTDTGD